MPKTWKLKFELNIKPENFVAILNSIDNLIRTLASMPIPPSALAKMERLNIIRAIRGTTGIEGNRLTEEEVAKIYDSPSAEAPIDVQERENYNASQVMRYVRDYEASPPLRLTEKMIKQIHVLTTEDIKNPLNEPGKYRRDYVYAGIYEFPDPKDVPALMKSFVTFINSPEVMTLHPIVRAVVAHFYFVTVHPFGDGNGRVARAIEAFLLFHSGYNAAGFYSLANYYYRNRREYIKQLDSVRFEYDGDLTEFTRFALNGFLLELTDIYNQAIPYMRVIKYSQTIDALVAEGDLSQRLGVALKEIAEMPEGLTSQEFIGRIPDWVRKLYRGKSERTLRYDLTLMKQSGLIEKVEGRIRARIEATR